MLKTILIVIGIILLSVCITLCILKEQKKKKKIQELQSYSDTVKPAEIMVKMIQKQIQDIINLYILSVNNNNISTLPKENMTVDFYKKTVSEIQRYLDLNIKSSVQEYIPSDKLWIRQENGRIYIVSGLIATARYEIKVLKEHSTFKTLETKKAERVFVFVGTNEEGWKLSEVQQEKITQQSKIDL